MTCVLTAGQRHETTKFEVLMEQGAVKRAGRGRPKLRPKRVLGDKAYSSVATRYEKRAVNFLAMVTLASILIWL